MLATPPHTYVHAHIHACHIHINMNEKRNERGETEREKKDCWLNKGGALWARTTKVNEAEVCEEKGKIKPPGQTGTRRGSSSPE